MSARNRNSSIAIAIGVTVFLYQGAQVIGDLNAWSAWNQPKEVSRLIIGGCFGFVAFLGALLGDYRAILARFFPGIFPPEKSDEVTTVTKEEQKI